MRGSSYHQRTMNQQKREYSLMVKLRHTIGAQTIINGKFISQQNAGGSNLG
jgi:hypothetical protein